MNDSTITLLVTFALIAHIAVGLLVGTGRSDRPLLPAMNLLVGLSILGYWIPRWYSYVANNIIWYATDQLVPLYAVFVCALCAFSLAGRYRGMVPHWIVFGVHAAVLVAFVVYMLTVRFDRML